MRQLGQPGAKLLVRDLFERIEAQRQLARDRILPLAQLGRELQQLGQAIGPLEAAARTHMYRVKSLFC
jgi:hypothetical protein